MRKSGLWFPRFFVREEGVSRHHAHPSDQHKHERPHETRARAIMRVLWERKRLGWRGFWGLFTLVLAVSLHAQSPVNQNSPLGNRNVSITFQDSSGTKIVTFASPFNFKCSTNLTCSVVGSTLTVAASGGAGSGYSTIQNAGVAIAQEATINFLGALVCADNAGNASSDCKLNTNAAVSHQFLTGIDANGNFLRAQPAYSDISGTPQLAQTITNAS